MSETNFRQFIASSELFSGYEVMLDLNYCNSLDDIVNSFYDNLQNCLTLNKFVVLLDELKDCRFHIHTYTLEDIILSDKNMIFYICDHC